MSIRDAFVEPRRRAVVGEATLSTQEREREDSRVAVELSRKRTR